MYNSPLLHYSLAKCTRASDLRTAFTHRTLVGIGGGRREGEPGRGEGEGECREGERGGEGGETGVRGMRWQEGIAGRAEEGGRERAPILLGHIYKLVALLFASASYSIVPFNNNRVTIGLSRE